MKINHIRVLLLVTIAMMFVSLIGRWQQTFPSNYSDQQKSALQQNNTNYSDLDSKTTNLTKTGLGGILAKKSNFSEYGNVKTVKINTQVFKNLEISLLNGTIISAALKDYAVSLKNKAPMELLTKKQDSEYIAKSTVALNEKPIAILFKSQGIKKDGAKQVLTLTGDSSGLKITRTYTFDDTKYDISVAQSITNTSSKLINVIVDNSLVRQFDPAGDSFSLLNANSFTFTGVAYSTDKSSFRKEPFKDISKTNGQATVIDNIGQGWIAFLQHYFVSAWIPQFPNSQIYYKKLANNVFEAGAYTRLAIAPKQSKSLSSILYTGPIIKDNLVNLAPNLEKTLDYGILSFFSEAIFWVMNHIFTLFGNWGLTIILVTVLIKALFYPLSAKSYRSMAKMRMLQPRIKRLQETYKDDRQKLGRKMMQIYKDEKVNPLSGCLPMIIQIPIFISLYWVLLESVELRHAPFIFWIKDLSIKDPYFVLPVLMGLSMFLQQKISPSPADPIQAKVMMLLPVIFTFLFASFASGLVLYWLTNNLISILQQWIITKSYQAKHHK